MTKGKAAIEKTMEQNKRRTSPILSLCIVNKALTVMPYCETAQPKPGKATGMPEVPVTKNQAPCKGSVIYGLHRYQYSDQSKGCLLSSASRLIRSAA